MSVLGIACDNDKISYVVVNGSLNSPKILENETYRLPKTEKGKLLDSANSRIEALLNSHKINVAVLLVIDKTYGKGHNTSTHPVKHQIEGCIMYRFFKEGTPFIEYNRTSKSLNDLKKNLNKNIDCKLEKLIDEEFSDIFPRNHNKDQREAFAVALTQL